MERNREGRRVSMAAAANGLPSRRRHRSGSLRDSPEDDGPVELQETARLRDRGAGKKDRDRDRERERERDRDRDRERERERDRDRMSSRGKRRRGDRLMHGSNREDGGDDSSEESINDDEDDEDDDGGGGGVGSSMRMLPPNPSSLSSSSMSNHHHRKSFPPPAKVFRAAPPTALWKAPDEMIGVSVPRKARSASTKRSHEWASSCGVGTEQIIRQSSTSPVRSSGPSVGAMVASAPAAASPASVSPSSSNASVKKKMKPNGPKQRPPKSSNKFISSAQEEIEFEIAEVLYGLMRQPQGPTKQDVIGNDPMKFDSREVNNNKPTGDAKSRVSSPISSSPSDLPPLSSIPPNSSSSATHMSAIAPKRKRPRPVKYEDENPSIVCPVRNSPVSSAIKVDIDQPPKIETCSPNLDKNSGSATENGVLQHDAVASQAASTVPTEPQVQPQPRSELMKSDCNPLLDSNPPVQELECRDSVTNKEEPQSPKKESPADLRLDGDRESVTTAETNSAVPEIETQREEKFQIDLMAPPPVRSPPERDSEIGFVAMDPKPMVTDVEMVQDSKPVVKEDEKLVKIGKDVNVELEEKKSKVPAEEVESQKPVGIVSKGRNIDLQLDLEKSDKDSGNVNGSGNKVHHHVQKQQQQQPNTEKAAQSSSVPVPLSMANWPGGLPHMGYMAPLQGVVSMDGSTVSSAAIQPPHLLFGQPRPKRCATHYYIARNIHYHQQFTRMNPFWSAAAASSALQFGAKACNMNVVPSSDLHAGRGVNSVQDKGQGLAIFPGHSGKEKNSQTANIIDAGQRKQILLQQPLPPGAPSNILPGPAFIFPLNQPQAAAAAAAASVRPGSVKSPPVAGSTASSSTLSTASMSATAPAVAGATAMSFNYPNMAGNEPQYLAILQNSAYPIPIPAHVGATPTYRGTPPQAMPFFNGSFYPSQMIHPPQLQQQQPPTSHSQQGQQGHQNPSISSGSSSSQKHLQRPHSSGINGGSGNLQGFPSSKSQPSQSLHLQQRQQMQNQNVLPHARQLESEFGTEDGPSTADSRVSRANMSIYGQNFAMAMPPPNFALMTPAIGSVSTASGNPGEKKQQQSQPQGSKVVEPSQAFALPFASINGATAAPTLDISSIAQNHALLQSLPEAARHGYHFMTAAAVAQAAQLKKNYRVSEEGKTGGNDSSNVEEERKVMSGGKVQATAGQLIAFSRPDLTDASVSLPGSSCIDSSTRTLSLGSTPARATGSVMSATSTAVNASSMQQQLQRNQQQQQQQQHHQQLIQLQKQQQFASASTRTKTLATSNGNVYSDHISSSSSMGKLSVFSPSLVQSSNSPVQSPQWKSSTRATTSQVPSPSLASTSSSLKTLPQQQGRIQPASTHISFAANPKSSAAPQGQPAPSSNQSPSPPMVVGSPTTSISKSAGGSPRTTSNSTSNKGGQSSTLSSQQTKNSPSVPSQKSSPVGGRNIPSILGHPHNSTSATSSANKSQLPQQQQLPKHVLQQAQMLYNSSYMPAQVQHTANSIHTASAPSGFHLQRHRAEQQQQPQGSSGTSPGMLFCSPVTLPNTTTTDPAKAAAASNMKVGGLPSQSFMHAQFVAAQSAVKPHLLPAGFTYGHAVPNAVQMKPAEQKQPAAE